MKLCAFLKYQYHNTHWSSLHKLYSASRNEEKRRKGWRDVEKRKSEVCVNGAMHFQSHIWILISCHKQWSPCASLLELWPPATDWSTSPAQWGCWRSGGYQQGSKSIRLIDVGATQSEVSSLAFSVPMKKIPDDEMSHSGPALMSVWLPAPSVSVSVLAEVCALTINWNYFYHRPLPHANQPPPSDPLSLASGLDFAVTSYGRSLQIAQPFPLLFIGLISILPTLS